MNQITAIQSILGKPPAFKIDNTKYDIDEKCEAIYEHMTDHCIEFDFKIVNNIQGRLRRRCKITDNEIQALDNIISGFSIDVGWCLS